MSVCPELGALRPQIFANGGDRKADNTPEVMLCEVRGIKLVFEVGPPKTVSSSWKVEAAFERYIAAKMKK
jgi:hypothetical protein